MLNQEQQKALEDMGNCIVASCPGSGKTHLIVEKTIHFLKTIPNSKIALVTFTKASAEEMKKRILAKYETDRVISSTFHSYAYKQLTDSGIKIKTPTNGEYYEIMRQVKLSLNSDESIAYIIEAVEYFNSKAKPESYRKEKNYIFYEKYREFMEQLKLLDFSEISRISLNGMKTGKFNTLAVTHIFADEYQDTDEIQSQWILEHVKKGVIVAVVGDDDQSIYSFRNSLGYEGMMIFEREAKATMHTLDRCYRCKEEILEIAVNVIEKNSERVNKNIRSAAGTGGKYFVKDFVNRDEELEAIVQFIFESHGSIGVLARSNTLLDAVEARCTANGIQVQRSSSETFWDSYGASFFISILESVIDDNNYSGIFQALSFIRADNDYIDEIINRMKTKESNLLGTITDENIKSFINNFKKWKTFLTKDIDIVLYGIAGWIEDHDKTKNNTYGRQADAAATSIAGMNGTIKQRLLKIKNQSTKTGEIPEHKVFLTTMHSSKGLEFDNVWILACEEGISPSDKLSKIKDNSKNIDEERRLFYVAMTRAKLILMMSYVKSEESTPSRFLVEAGVIS